MRSIYCLLLIFTPAVAIGKTVANNYGRVCGFGDFNNDRYTDIIVHNGENVTVMLQESKLLTTVLEDGTFKNSSTFKVGTGRVECTLGDFNGDARLDVLISKKVGRNRYEHTVWYATTGDDYYSRQLDDLFSQAMAVDVDGDGWHDILGFTPDGELYCRHFDKLLKNLTPCDDLFSKFEKISPYPGMPHIYADVVGDQLLADLIFMGKNESGYLTMTTYNRYKHGWKKAITQIPTCESKYVGAPVVADFNADSRLEILLPICKDEKCDKISQVAIWQYDENERRPWVYHQFDVPELLVLPEEDSKVIFRVGDFSLDGYPDLLCTTVNPNGTARYPKIIENNPCEGHCNNTRIFKEHHPLFIQPREVAISTITMSSFFDLREDGSLDILVEYKLHDTDTTKFSFIVCDEKGDVTFLKVQVFTNVCVRDCNSPQSEELGSGISWGGVCMSFSMNDGWGGSLQSAACQLPMVTHRSLMHPYVLFGLGRSPNFVEELSVGAPRYTDSLTSPVRLYTQKQIVPNSRIIMIPPENDNRHWISRLYVTPSQLILQSLFVMASTCALLLIVVFVLHYRERKEDRVERQQQSHRFHFDAM